MITIIFKTALKKFKKHLLVERSYSALTVKEYQSDLKLFYTYLLEEHDFEENFHVEQLSKYDVADFLSDLILEKDNSPSTRNRKLYSLRSFFKFLIKYEFIKSDPTGTLEASKTRTRAEPIYLRTEQARRYITAIKTSEKINKIRDLAIVKLFLYAGLRISELVNLDLEDVDYVDKSIKFFGKGDKERYLPLHVDVIKAIIEYLPERNKITPRNDDATKALFLSRHGNRICARTVQLFIKEYARKAGLKNAEKITPHKLRHTFATILYRETKDIKILQELLGHADISTTQIYTHTDNERKKEAIDDFPEL